MATGESFAVVNRVFNGQLPLGVANAKATIEGVVERKGPHERATKAVDTKLFRALGIT